MLRRLLVEEDGQGLVEYALILGLVSVAVIGVLSQTSAKLKNLFINITGQLGKASAPTGN